MCADLPTIGRPVAEDDAAKEALRALVLSHQDSLYRLAYRILGRSADAEEARQSVFLKLVERPHLLDSVQCPGAWLKRCVVNEAMLILRRNRRRKEIEHADSPSFGPSGLSADDETKTEQIRIVQELMETLDPEVRAMLSLRFDDELTIREIGRVLDQPHTTIQSRLDSAIRRLRTALLRRS